MTFEEALQAANACEREYLDNQPLQQRLEPHYDKLAAATVAIVFGETEGKDMSGAKELAAQYLSKVEEMQSRIDFWETLGVVTEGQYNKFMGEYDPEGE